MRTLYAKTLEGALISSMALWLAACGGSGDPKPVWETRTIEEATISLDEQNNIDLASFRQLAHHSASGQKINQVGLGIQGSRYAEALTTDGNRNQYRAYFTATDVNTAEQKTYLQVDKFSETGQLLTSYSGLAAQASSYPLGLELLVDGAENIYVSYNTYTQSAIENEQGNLLKLNGNLAQVFEKHYPQHPIHMLDVTPQGSLAIKVRFDVAPDPEETNLRYDLNLISPAGVDIKSITPVDLEAGYEKVNFIAKALSSDEMVILASLSGSTTQADRVNVIKYDAQGNTSFKKPFTLADSISEQSKLILDEAGNLVVAFTCIQSKCANTTLRHQIILSAFDIVTGEEKWQYKENTPTSILTGKYKSNEWGETLTTYYKREIESLGFDKLLVKNGQVWFNLRAEIPYEDQSNDEWFKNVPNFSEDVISIDPQTATKTKQLTFLKNERVVRDFAIDTANQVLISSSIDKMIGTATVSLFK